MKVGNSDLVRGTLIDCLRSRLTPQHKLFIDNYMTTFDEGKSAKSIGLAARKGKEIIALPEVAAEIALRINQTSEDLQITTKRILTELARIAFIDPAEFYDEGGNVKDIHSISETARRAISEYSESTGRDGEGRRRVRVSDKLRALELLGKYLGMYKDHLEVTGLTTLATDLEDARRRRIEAARAVDGEVVDAIDGGSADAADGEGQEDSAGDDEAVREEEGQAGVLRVGEQGHDQGGEKVGGNDAT